MSAADDGAMMRTLRLERTARRPVWMMRQAGRHLEEYRRTRERAGSFMRLCQTPELACEVTLQPVRRYGLDAAIIFSDILTVPDAMGLGLTVVEGEGPRFARPLDTERRMLGLAPPDPQALAHTCEAIAMARNELRADVPLIGFAGAPFTLMCYMVDGQGGDFMRARLALAEAPAAAHHVLRTAADAVGAHLAAQADAGADIVMVFESWGSLLSDAGFNEFSLPYIRQALAALAARRPETPAIVFVRAGGSWCEQIAQSGCAAIGVDWRADLGDVRARTGGKVAVQGNMDPAVLLAADPGTVRREAARCLREYGPFPGHVFNLGHGIDRRTPPANVEAMVEAVRDESERLLAGGPDGEAAEAGG